MTKENSHPRPRRRARHPNLAEVTADRLGEAYEKFNNRLDGTELDMISQLRHTLGKIADDLRCPCGNCALTFDDPIHGSPSAYTNYDCRCTPCRAAQAAEAKHQKKLRASSRPIPDRVHGTEGGYSNWDCHCDACLAAWSAATSRRSKAARARKKAQEKTSK